MPTQPEILSILEDLAQVYGVEPGNVRAYYWTLADYPQAVLEAAAKEHIKTSKWFPKPSELRDACEKVKYHRGIDTAAVYWRGMSELSQRLRGEITDDQIERSRAWCWCERRVKFEDVAEVDTDDTSPAVEWAMAFFPEEVVDANPE